MEREKQRGVIQKGGTRSCALGNLTWFGAALPPLCLWERLSEAKEVPRAKSMAHLWLHESTDLSQEVTELASHLARL